MFPSFPDFLQKGRDTQQEGKQGSLGVEGMLLTLDHRHHKQHLFLFRQHAPIIY